MSLRRPFRDSWEQRNYKKPARSVSPPALKPSWEPIRRLSPSPEPAKGLKRSLVSGRLGYYVKPTIDGGDGSESDDDYSEKRALTPPLDDRPSHRPDTVAPRQETVGRFEFNDEHLGPEPGDATKFSFDDRFNVQKTAQEPNADADDSHSLHAIVDFREDFQLRGSKRSNASTITPGESVSNQPSLASICLPSPQIHHVTPEAEPEYLRSEHFPVQCLRPVPDFAMLFAQITPAIGDPGSGLVTFGDDSLNKPVFEDAEVIKLKKLYAHPEGSVLNEESIGTTRKDYLVWSRDLYRPRSTTPDHGRASVRTLNNNSSSSTKVTPNTWPGRKYSINPVLRTRNLTINLLERRISHGELLSLNLNPDARRDAIAIGGTPHDIGGSLLTGTGCGASPAGLAADVPSLHSSDSSTTSNVNVSSSRSLIVHPASNGREPRSRSRSAARDASISVASGAAGYTRPIRVARTVKKAGYDEYDQQNRRYRAGHVSAAFETGRYGVGGMMLWRLVRVGAVVENGGQMEEHVAWWCVPERTMGGYF